LIHFYKRSEFWYKLDSEEDRAGDAVLVMNLLQANLEAQVKAVLPVGQSLVPPDRITHIRIRYYTLRLAKSDVFTPKLWEYKWIVDQYMEFLKEEDELFSVQTSGNNLTKLEKKFGGSRESDWDSGFSDG